MHIVHKSKVDLIDGKLVAEASDIGLQAGQWPVLISVVDDQNEGCLFHRANQIVNHEEFCGYDYYDHSSGVKLTIFND